MIDGGGETGEAVEVGDLSFDSRAIGLGKRFGGFIVCPIPRRFRPALRSPGRVLLPTFPLVPAFCSFVLSRFEIDVSAPAMANVEEASSFRNTNVISERWLEGSA